MIPVYLRETGKARRSTYYIYDVPDGSHLIAYVTEDTYRFLTHIQENIPVEEVISAVSERHGGKLTELYNGTVLLSDFSKEGIETALLAVGYQATKPVPPSSPYDRFMHIARDE